MKWFFGRTSNVIIPLLLSCVCAENTKETCDPATTTEMCSFETAVDVTFDEKHLYLLNEAKVMENFGFLFSYWFNVNYKLCLGELDEFFKGIDFDVGGSAFKMKKTGRGKGYCKGRKCPKKIPKPSLNKKKNSENMGSNEKALRGVNNEKFENPCAIGLLAYLQGANPQYFADVTDVSVDISDEDQKYTIWTAQAPTVFKWTQIGQDMNGNPEEQLGSGVQLSGDGNRIFVLGFGNVLKMFTRFQGRDGNQQWNLESDLSSFFESFGLLRLASTPDGQTLAVSSFQLQDNPCVSSNGSYMSEIEVITQASASIWAKKGPSIMNPSSECGVFGYSLAISNDGDTITTGDHFHGNAYSFKYESGPTTSPTSSPIYNSPTSSPISNSNAVTTNAPSSSPTFYCYCRTTGLTSFISRFIPQKRIFNDDKWVLSHTFSKKNPLEDTDSYFGWAIAMTGDGLKLFVGSYLYYDPDFGYGVVFVFSLTEGSEILRINGKGYELLGVAIAVSNDGNRLAISSYSGASGYDKGAGSVALYNQGTDGNYTQVGTRIYVAQAETISFSLDGNRLVIGSFYNDEVGEGAGKTFVYSVSDDGTELAGEFVGRNYSHFGFSVALSEDGSTVAIGGPDFTNTLISGYVQVFDSDVV